MKKTITVLKTIQDQKEVEFPFYVEDSGALHMISDEKNSVRVFVTEDETYASVTISDISVDVRIFNGTPCDKNLFNEQYQKALKIFNSQII